MYIQVSEKEQAILQLLEGDEKLVYQHVKASDNQGIWVKDVIRNTNLHQQVINKIIKSLENKNILKSVKSVKVR